MTTPKTLRYPFFERGLPLRSSDLNALLRFTEGEERRTRTCLLGMGIFYGLDVSVDTSQGIKVVLTEGVGVTSQGYLYCRDAQDATKNFLNFTSTDIPTALFSDFELSEYVESFENSARWSTDTVFKALEIQDNSSSGNPLKAADIIDKYLVIFFQLQPNRLVGCATCDKGVQASLTVRHLLLTEADFIKINTCHPEGSTQSNFNADDLFIRRFGLIENCFNGSEIDSVGAFFNNYAIPCKEAVGAMINLMPRLATYFDKIFGDTEGALMATHLNSLKTFLDNLDPNKEGNQSAYIQYAHDYIRLMIRAYNEFVSTPFVQAQAAMPPANCFPKHLALGKFVQGQGDNNTILFQTNKTIRTQLFRPVFDDLTNEDFEAAKFLYNRLLAILKNHKLNEIGIKPLDVLRITPSRRSTYPISKQAIPYYLNGEILRPLWHRKLTLTRRDKTIFFYSDTTNNPPSLTNNPLKTQPAFDEADFYRIEGLIGKTLTADEGARNPLEVLKDCHNLPFQIVVTHLSNANSPRSLSSFNRFAVEHPGIEHQGGVQSGGTFIVLVDSNNKIIGDFCLPYWIQPIVEPVVADFTTTQKGNVFMFDATPSSINTQNIRWSTNGGQIKNAVFTGDKTYQPTLVLEQGETTKHFFIKLEAFTADGQKDVEITTVVITQRVALPDQVVAAISILERTSITNGEKIQFDSFDSKFAQEFEWFKDGVPNVKTPKMTADFVFDNERQTSKSFLIKLLARNKESQREDVEEIVITINRTLQPPPVARFNLIDMQGNAASPEGTIVPFSTVSLGNTYQLHIPTTNIERLNFLLNFNNFSENIADRYEWNVFIVINDVNVAPYLDKPVVIKDKTKFSTAAKQLVWNIKASEQNQLKYRIELTAIGVNGEKSILSSFISLVVDPPIILVVNPNDAVPVVDVINVIDVNEEKIPPFRRDIMDEPTPAKSTVDPKEALKALRTRHRDYRKAIEQAAIDTPELGKVKSYQSVVGFITGFQDDLARLDKQDAEFKKHALQFIQNIKRAGGIPDSVYQLVLKNMVFFYLDKLSHLLPDGLTTGVQKTLTDFFTKAQLEESFGPQSAADVRAEWQADDIRTEQNTRVIDELNVIFNT